MAVRVTREGKTMAEETICWFDAVDWGSQQHQACLLDSLGAIVGE